MNFLMIGLIKFYQLLKPAWHQVMLTVFGVTFTCQHQESCSNYTIRQIRNRGTIAGLSLGLQRTIRCLS
jgi:putative component of membrane protein insertase Oxa1/YidC/SpoIIIJ protein YidD